MCWLFPGKKVRIHAPCLDCNDPILLEMEDGKFLTIEPAEVVGHLNHPWPTSVEARPFT